MGYRTYTCPIAARCGGCEWLAVPYPIQLRRKREAVQALLDEALGGRGGSRVEVAEVRGMDEPVRYRHKAATPFAPGPKGQLRCGFYAAGTHRIVRCDDCLAEAPGARETLFQVARVARELGIPAYAEDRGSGVLRHAVLRVGWRRGEALLTVVANADALPREREFAARLLQACRERPGARAVTSLVLNVNTRRTNAILGFRSRTLRGSGVMLDELLGCAFEIGPTSFYQTNPAQTEVLYQLAFEAAGLAPGMRVLDAYCGTGTIGICAAHAVNDLQVIGVERVGEAVACAERNARANGLAEQARFVSADATEWMREAAARGEQVDAVILDPPRAGSTEAFLDGVCTLAPERVGYVSCNPATLARDLAYLVGRGWRVESAVPVDLFPHTKHCEMVVGLRR